MDEQSITFLSPFPRKQSPEDVVFYVHPSFQATLNSEPHTRSLENDKADGHKLPPFDYTGVGALRAGSPAA